MQTNSFSKMLAAILIMLFVHSWGWAQDGFTDGYIVRSNRDTLHGFLQDEVRRDIQHSIKFKTDHKASAYSLFDCSTVQSFGYNGGNLYQAIDFTNTSGDSAIKERCFARLLVKGFYNLYSVLEDETAYFLIKIDNDSYFLFNSAYTSNGELKTQGNYISRLAQFAAECDADDLNAERISYTEKDIAGFVTGLDTCLAPGIIPVNYYHKPRTKFEFMIFAGGLPLSQQTQFTGEAFIRMTYPQLGKKTSINIGIHYSSTLRVSKIVDNYNYSVGKVTTRDQIFSIPATLQYNFTTGFIQTYLYAGFSGAVLNETVNSDNTTAAGLQGKFGIAILAGVGIDGRLTKRLYVRADWRYELILQYPSVGVVYKLK
jgi:hypothetical protein